jgi:EAL and modified HD-GYP domain-containing signal transduction protein
MHNSAGDGALSLSAFVGRQPIFDNRLAVYGYELLYRCSQTDIARFSDQDAASAEIALSAYLDFGLDTLVADRRAFINLTRAVLLSGFCRQLPPDRVVLEVLENMPCDEAVQREVEALASAGYQIALDDFAPNDPRTVLLPQASIVKVDIETFDEAALRTLLRPLHDAGVDLVAERVETREQLDLCRSLGMTYFQGFFFARPTTVQGRRIPVERLTALRVLALLADDESPLRVIAEAVAADVKLSYQVLRAVNSAASAPASPIESIPAAIMRLGRSQLRGWLSVMALSGLDGKPSAVVTLALTRARMCEGLAQASGAPASGTWFMTGLFSTLDLLFNAPLVELLDGLPLPPPVTDAIARRSGDLGAALDAVVAFERGEWNAVRCGRLTPRDFTRAFRSALDWTRDWERVIQTP